MIPPLFTFLRKETRANSVKIFTTCAISGMANAVVVVIVNAAAQNYDQMNFRYLALFILCILIYVLSYKYAAFQTAVAVRDVINKTHLRIADKIRGTTLRSFESIGHNRIYTTLSEHTEIIFEASRMIIACSSSVIMLVFSFMYLAYLSSIAFWIAVGLISCSIIIYRYNQREIEQEFIIAADKEEEFFTALDHLLHGFKEVKMNRARSNDIFSNYLTSIMECMKNLKIKTEKKFLNNYIFAQISWFMLMAAIVFLLPQMSDIPTEKIMAITMVVLFIIGPTSTLAGAIPILIKANFAVRKLKELEQLLDSYEDLQETIPVNPFAGKEEFRTISLKDINFSYDEQAGSGGFSVGPIDMEIKSGELLFIVGGNGTGKTTLLKLIAGLYYPSRGCFHYNDLTVNNTNYDHYRNSMSIIFTEFHLFDRLYGLEDVDEDKLNQLLRTMKLTEKTSYIDGKFSNINLSTGQRKRLALIVALMEDRDILVFDELAADQDPVFRKYFYEQLLKDLQAQGKTIICTSHDDRYFHVADRIITMEYGKIIDAI